MADEPTPENETPETPEVEAAVTEEAPEAAATDDAPEAPTAAEPEVPAEPEEKLHPKEARKRARATGPSRRTANTPEARVELRKAKAKARTRRRGQEREKAKKVPKTEPLAPVEHPKGSPKVRQGLVVSAKPDKTITVRVDSARRHRRYEKIVRSSSTLHVHDETNDANEGDTVRVVECRPMSRLKRWKLEAVLERAK